MEFPQDIFNEIRHIIKESISYERNLKYHNLHLNTVHLELKYYAPYPEFTTHIGSYVLCRLDGMPSLCCEYLLDIENINKFNN